MWNILNKWNFATEGGESTWTFYRFLTGFAFHFCWGRGIAILCEIFPHIPKFISQSNATKDMTSLLLVTFHAPEWTWTLVPVNTAWFAMVRIRLYLTAYVISRFNRHRFKPSPPFDPLDSLELLHLLWQYLWMNEFMTIQGYFNDNSPSADKGKRKRLVVTGTSASSPQPTSFLTDWLWSEFLFMVKGWKLLCVCGSTAATDLWTWHAW